MRYVESDLNPLFIGSGPACSRRDDTEIGLAVPALAYVR
jgi:hypothetical protein